MKNILQTCFLAVASLSLLTQAQFDSQQRQGLSDLLGELGIGTGNRHSHDSHGGNRGSDSGAKENHGDGGRHHGHSTFGGVAGNVTVIKTKPQGAATHTRDDNSTAVVSTTQAQHSGHHRTQSSVDQSLSTTTVKSAATHAHHSVHSNPHTSRNQTSSSTVNLLDSTLLSTSTISSATTSIAQITSASTTTESATQSLSESSTLQTISLSNATAVAVTQSSTQSSFVSAVTQSTTQTTALPTTSNFTVQAASTSTTEAPISTIESALSSQILSPTIPTPSMSPLESITQESLVPTFTLGSIIQSTFPLVEPTSSVAAAGISTYSMGSSSSSEPVTVESIPQPIIVPSSTIGATPTGVSTAVVNSTPTSIVPAAESVSSSSTSVALQTSSVVIVPPPVGTPGGIAAGVGRVQNDGSCPCVCACDPASFMDMSMGAMGPPPVASTTLQTIASPLALSTISSSSSIVDSSSSTLSSSLSTTSAGGASTITTAIIPATFTVTTSSSLPDTSSIGVSSTSTSTLADTSSATTSSISISTTVSTTSSSEAPLETSILIDTSSPVIPSASPSTDQPTVTSAAAISTAPVPPAAQSQAAGESTLVFALGDPSAVPIVAAPPPEATAQGIAEPINISTFSLASSLILGSLATALPVPAKN